MIGKYVNGIPRRAIMRIQPCLILVAGLLIAQRVPLAAAESTAPPESNEQRIARMKWWQEARFGMFIHWGPVSLKGTEIGWSRSPARISRRHSPPNMTASTRSSIPRNSSPPVGGHGQGRRHEVHGLHDQAPRRFLRIRQQAHRLQDHQPASPFHRNVVKELADACHEAGIAFGLIIRRPTPIIPDYRTGITPFHRVPARPDRRELLSNYGQVDVIWFDGLGGTAKDWDAPRLFALIKRLQPNIIINDRVGLAGDFSSPEQTVGGFQWTGPGNPA